MGNRDRLLKHIHRAILTSSHTAALCRNFSVQGRIKKKAGEDLAVKLDSLDEALSELSLACLGLSAEAIVDPSEGESGTSIVTVLLTNRGIRTINFVKIGAVGKGGTRITPGELATFGSVRPGETARAVYTVRFSHPVEFANVAAHVGYLAGKSPVRLRLRPAI
jgi:hypothetical protein